MVNAFVRWASRTPVLTFIICPIGVVLASEPEELADLPESGEEEPEFSLVLGGPMYQLFRRAHLSGTALELLERRIIVLALAAWLPLLVLSMLAKRVAGEEPALPFLHDIEAQVRLLVALPLLIAAELIVHSRIRPVVKAFLAQGIVRQGEVPKFLAAVRSAMRLRNSVALELGLVVFVLTVGQWIWRSHLSLTAPTWYAIPEGGRLSLTAAGYWYAWVSIPLFQFVLLRWYMRLFIWFRFLWAVSRLDLHLVPTHPDRAGGLGFLGRSSYAFALVLFAQGTVLAGLIATRVLYDGEKLLSFKMDAGGFIGFFLAFVLLPLVLFSPQLVRAKRLGLAVYGQLANRYVSGFERKWVTGEVETEPLLGSADIQSLADLGNSYAVVREMRAVPFSWQDVIQLALTTAAPLLPLALTTFSLEELVSQIAKVLF